MPTQKKQTKRPTSVKKTATLKSKSRFNIKFVVLITILVAAIGAYFLFFASAATNNCQAENGVQICDVDMTGGGGDTVLSVTGEAQSLGSQGWGVYYGADFRAPTSAYNGAVAITRVYNSGATLHDWVTASQKSAKEAKYGALTNEGVAFFAWESQKPGTVPVYRLGRGGGSTQNIYSTDKAWIDRIVAEGANDPNGWKADLYGPLVAFYAFPPNYKVANQVNPYDCSLQVNLVTDRCKDALKNLTQAVAAGNIPTSNDCPKTLEVYRKAPFPGQFSADCQKFWNTYMQDCRITENFTSDRCKTQREALAKAQAAQIAQRTAAQAVAKKAASSNKKSSSGGGPTPTPTPTTRNNCSSKNLSQSEKNFCATIYLNAVKATQRANVYQNTGAASMTLAGSSYVCYISGERQAKTVNNTLDSATYWYSAGLSKSFYAPDASNARRQCESWRTQTNKLDTYRGFTIKSLTKK